MRTRSLIRATFNIGRPASHLPPAFLFPLRARLHQASTSPTQFSNTPPEIPPYRPSSKIPLNVSTDQILPNTVLRTPRPPERLEPSSNETPFSESGNAVQASSPSARTAPPSKPLVLSSSLQQLLPYLTSQPPYYITAHIHRFPYLLTEGDVLRLPFHMHGVSPGDELRLNRASLLGSRDYTLKAGSQHTEVYDKKRTGEPNYIDERLFVCRATVMGLESTPMSIKEKTKRRQRRVKKVYSKHRYTVLRVSEVRVKTLEELEAGSDVLVFE